MKLFKNIFSSKLTIPILLSLIIVFSFVIRAWQLGEVPPSPDWDEAALGYNAYSILHTGHDEYGKLLPLILRSFDDYKPALYTYFIIPLLPIFGLSIISVRLPSVIFGTLTVWIVYFLVKELLGYNEEDSGKFSIRGVALLSSLMLAISPWHIQFSRIAFESNTGMAFNVFAVYTFIKGLKSPKWLFLSISLMSLNLYIYQSEKVFTPLLGLILLFVFRKEIFKISKKKLSFIVILGIFIALPMVIFTLTNKEGLARARGVSVFSDQTQFLKNNAEKLIRDNNNHDTLGKILDNRRIAYGKAVVSGYIAHFDLNWLFITGDLTRHHAPYMGLLYLWEMPFILAGIYYLVFGKFSYKGKLVIILWYLAAAIPASVTSGVPHSIRTLNFLPLYPLFTALGILGLFYFLRESVGSNVIRVGILGISMFLILFNFAYYLDQYFVQQNYYVSEDWQYGYSDAVKTVSGIQKNYQKIIVSNQPYLDQSYMFFLFYLQYPPALYQKESMDASGGFRENHSFGKFQFRPIDWKNEQKNENTLYVGRENDFDSSAKVLKTIYFLDGKPAIKIVQG